MNWYKKISKIAQTDAFDEERKAKKDRYNQILSEMKKFPPSLTKEEAQRYTILAKELESLRYDLVRSPRIEDIQPPEQRKSIMPSELVLTARQDLRSSKDIFLAIADASNGVWFDQETAIDDIVRGRNLNISFVQLYNSFRGTREALRSKFGNTIKLFRAQGKQKAKPTQNWATTEEYARQFGNNVISKDIPVENIIAVNVGLSGNYHELIVGEPPR